MIAMKPRSSLYEILGILPDAEDVVVKAAYRSLSQKWHPDKNQDNLDIASARMAEINRAYEVLGDPLRRREYDEELRRTGENNRYNTSSTDDPLEAEPDSHDWQIAMSYFPAIAEHFQYLKRLEHALAFAFREVLLSTKKFNESARLFENARQAFLIRYFGSDRSLQSIAEVLIISGHRKVALEINDVVRVLGDSVPAEKLVAPILARNSLIVKDGKVLTKQEPERQAADNANSSAKKQRRPTAEYFSEALDAIREFKISRVRELVELDNKLLSHTDSSKNSLLVYSVKYRAGTIFQLLVELGANTNTRTADGKSLYDLITTDPHMLDWSRETMLNAIKG